MKPNYHCPTHQAFFNALHQHEDCSWEDLERWCEAHASYEDLESRDHCHICGGPDH